MLQQYKITNKLKKNSVLQNIPHLKIIKDPPASRSNSVDIPSDK